MARAMTVAQVVPYISADSAFGGPVTVALAQSMALADAGHDVHLYAAWDGIARVHCPGVVLHLARVRRPKRLGLLCSPALALALWRRRKVFDAVHLHFGRDLVSLGAWLAVQGVHRRVALQPHGMIAPDGRLTHRVVDAISTRRALRSAGSLLALTDHERLDLQSVARVQVAVRPIRNGLSIRRDVVVERATPHEVLFLARLHPRKNVLVFAEAVRLLVASGSRAHFTVVGPDEGDLPALQDFIVEHRLQSHLRYEGAVTTAESAARLARASVYVLPSTGEVFPMTVIESMSVGTPVVLSDDCALADELRDVAVIIAPAAAPLASSIGALLADEEKRRALAIRGHKHAVAHFEVDAVRDLLLDAYRSSDRATVAR